MFYARDDEHRAEIMAPEFRANANVEVGRFKGLGEMMPAQLKETTMDPKKRTLLKLMLAGNVQPPPPTHCCVYRGGTVRLGAVKGRITNYRLYKNEGRISIPQNEPLFVIQRLKNFDDAKSDRLLGVARLHHKRNDYIGFLCAGVR